MGIHRRKSIGVNGLNNKERISSVCNGTLYSCPFFGITTTAEADMQSRIHVRLSFTAYNFVQIRFRVRARVCANSSKLSYFYSYICLCFIFVRPLTKYCGKWMCSIHTRRRRRSVRSIHFVRIRAHMPHICQYAMHACISLNKKKSCKTFYAPNSLPKANRFSHSFGVRVRCFLPYTDSATISAHSRVVRFAIDFSSFVR